MIDQHRDILSRYSGLLETLSVENVGDLADFCAENVHFKDPFNDHYGKQAYIEVLTDMFYRLDQVRFTVKKIDVTESGGYLVWTFSAKSRATGHIEVEGSSRIEIDAQGLISEHIDYWDGSEAMVRIPLIGAVIRYIKRRAAFSG